MLGIPIPEDLCTNLRSILCSDNMLKTAEVTDTVTFWTMVSKKYPESFGKVVPNLLCLPNSNAATERLFSLLKHVHTPVRNSLKLDTINSILAIKVNKTTPYTQVDLSPRQKVACKLATTVYNTAHSSL